MQINEKLQIILMELRSRLENLYRDRLVKIMLYGSQARGEAVPGSDIDILVILKGVVNSGEEIDRSLEIVADLSLQNDEVISCLYIDEERFTSRNGPLLRNIRKEGIPI